MQPDKTKSPDIIPDEKPPIFQTWNQLYAFVLLLHAFIIFSFYLFTKAFS